MNEDLPFTVFRVSGHELLGGGINYKIALGAYHAAVREYPRDQIELRQGTRVVGRSWRVLVAKMMLLEPERAARGMPGAVLVDSMGSIVTGWELTEPELRKL